MGWFMGQHNSARCEITPRIHHGYLKSIWHTRGTTKCACGYKTEKLAFFFPDEKKNYFKVMHFGPVNAPSFYLCMIGNFKSEWDSSFIKVLESYAATVKLIDGLKVHTSNGSIFLGPTQLYSGTKSIIDDILIWYSNIVFILIYFEYVC